MKKFNWKRYKSVILALHTEGKSSTDIYDVLKDVDGSISSKSGDRQIRKLINKWSPKLKDKNTIRPKVLVFDIETAPMKAYVWGKWKQNVQDSHIIDDWFMISWSAKWLFEDNVMSDVLTSKEALKQDDSRITKSIWNLLNEADVVIGHNALKFDIRKLNSRFLLNKLILPTPYEVIDTLAHARKKFAMTSNRLDYLAKILGFDGKLPTDFSLWANCLAGDKVALKNMQVYCDQDVKVLEDVYLLMRPYIQPHPNIALHIADGITRCPSCGGIHLKSEGSYRTTVNSYEALRCTDCGSLSRNRKSNMDKDVRKAILSSIPK